MINNFYIVMALCNFNYMSKKLKTIPVTMDDVSFIFNNDLSGFHYLASHCFCSQCKNKYDSTIIKYSILLNQLYDLELKGVCKDCGNVMGRYMETGDSIDTAKNAEAAWKTSKTLKELKIKKMK
jgi:hypothetical protein